MSQATTATRRPESVTRASQVIWLLVAVATLAVVRRSWSTTTSSPAWVGGQGRSPDDTRVPPSFTPVVVVLYVVVSSLLLVLLAFLRGGHGWARHCIAAGAALVAVAVVSGLRTDPPLRLPARGAGHPGARRRAPGLLYLPATNAYVGRIGRSGAAGPPGSSGTPTA